MTKSLEFAIARNRVKELADQQFESIYQFWKASGINRMSAYSLYNDRSVYPSERSMVLLCRLFDVTPSDIIEIENNPPAPKNQGIIDAIATIKAAQKMNTRTFGYFLKAHEIDEQTLIDINADRPLEPDAIKTLKKFFRKHGVSRHHVDKMLAEVEIRELEAV